MNSFVNKSNIYRQRIFKLKNILLFFILQISIINCAYYGQPQQAPPTSLTIKNNQRYNTTYACEGSQLSISCDEPGSKIKIVRSNFGRFSIQICNSQGTLDWSVNCFSKDTFELIGRACNGQKQCSLQASVDLFGNPCPNTYKYLEVHFQCINFDSSNENLSSNILSSNSQSSNSYVPKVNNNVNSVHNVNTVINLNNLNKNNRINNGVSVPPSIIIPPGNPSLKHHSSSNNNLNRQPAIPIVPILSTPSSIFLSSNNLDTNKQNNQPNLLDSNDKDLFMNVKEKASSIYTSSFSKDYNLNSLSNENQPIINTDLTTNILQNSTNYCPPVFARGLNWNKTETDFYASQPCPLGSSGTAQWYCSPPTNNINDPESISLKAHWVPQQPIFSQCQSSWLTLINRRLLAGESALLLSEDLSNSIAETNQFFGGDIRGITELLRLLLQPLELMIAQHRHTEQTKISKEMLASFETICSTLLENVYRQSWYEVSPSDRKTAASSLIFALQRNAILYLDSLNENQHDYIKLHNNLYIANHILPTDKYIQSELNEQKQNDLVLPLSLIDKEQIIDGQNNFNLVLQNQFIGNFVSIPSNTLLRYSTNGFVKISIMMFKKLDAILEPELLKENGEYNENKLGPNVTQMLNSDIISIILNGDNPLLANNPSIYISSTPLILTFRHLLTANVSNPKCVHWNNELKNWSDTGCYLLETNLTHSQCSCKPHLKNFALLMYIQDSVASNLVEPDKSSVSTSFNDIFSLNGLDDKIDNFSLNQYSKTGVILLVFIVIGSIISIIFLAITLTSLCCLVVKRNLLATVFEQCKLDNIPLVQKNLTLNLLIKQIIFLILICSSSYIKEKSLKCNIYYAFLLIGFYYLLLSTFSWLFFTCYELYCVVCSKSLEFNTMLAAHAHAAGTLNSANSTSIHCSPANSASSSNGSNETNSTNASGSAVNTTTTTTMLSNGQLATTTTTTLNNDNSTANTVSQESQRRHRRLIYKIVPIILPIALVKFVYYISKVQLVGINQINVCSVESRVHFAALILITALLTLAVNLLFVLCTWRKIRSRSNSTTDFLHPNLMLITNGNNPHQSSLPELSMMNSVKNNCDSLDLNTLPRFSPFTKKERLALYSSLTGTLLIIINATLMILYLTHQFTFVGYLLALTNTLVGIHLFFCCCLSRSRIRCKYGELFGKFKRRLVCHRQSNKSSFLDSQLFNPSTLISPHNLNSVNAQLHSRNATLKQSVNSNNNILDNPLITSSQLSTSKYFLNSTNGGNSDMTDTSSDYGCKRLQVHGCAATLNPSLNQHLHQKNNSVNSVITNLQTQQHHNSSNQHLYHLYTAKQGCNPYNCHHNMVEHVYECIDEEPYVAKLLMSQQQAAAQLAALQRQNSRTLGYRTMGSQQHVQHIQYLQQHQQLQQQLRYGNNSGNNVSTNNGNNTNCLLDRPLIPTLSASNNYLNMIGSNNQNKRLALLPSIVKDNGKTTIICGDQNSNDMRELSHQQNVLQQPDIQPQSFSQFNKQNMVTVLNGNNKIVSSTNPNNDLGIDI